MSFIIELIIILFINSAVSFIVGILIPDYYLAQMVSSIIIAALFTLFTFRGQNKLKNVKFWTMLLSISIIFLLLDLLFFLI